MTSETVTPERVASVRVTSERTRLAALGSVLVAVACAEPDPVDPMRAVAVEVREQGRSLFTLERREVAADQARVRLELGRDAPPLEPAARRARLREQIFEHLVDLRAEALDVQTSTRAVAREMARMRAELGEDPPELHQVYRDWSELEDRIRARLRLAALIRQTHPPTPPDAAALERVWQALPEAERTRPPAWRIVQLSFDSRAEAEIGRAALAASPLRARVEAGPRARVAWIQRGELLPEVERACLALEPGATSPIVESADGYHVVRVLETRPALVMGPEAMRDQLLDALRAEAEHRFRRELMASVEIVLHPDVLAAAGIPEIGDPR